MSLPSSAAKYVSTETATFTLQGTGPDGESLPETDLQSGDNLVTDLTPGDWSFSVLGYTADGTLIQQGAADVTLVAGADNAAAITLSPVTTITTTFGAPEVPPLALSAADIDGSLIPTGGVTVFTGMSPSSLVVTANDGFDTYRWYIDGVLQSASGSTWSNDGNDISSVTGGSVHRVQVIAGNAGNYTTFSIVVREQLT